MNSSSAENSPLLYPPNCTVLKPLERLQGKQIETLEKHSDAVGKVLGAITQANVIEHYQELASNGKTERIRERAMRNLAKWAMLGRPLQLAGLQQAQAPTAQVNLNVTMTEDQARAILRQLAGNQATSGVSAASEIIDIEPPVDNLARLKADIEAAQAQNQCHMDDINSSKINDVTNL